MNPEDPSWNTIIARQQIQGMRREEEERMMREQLKQKYHDELRNQIQQSRRQKQQLIEREKYQDRKNIARSLQNQQKVIEMEKTKMLYEKPKKKEQPFKEPKLIHNKQVRKTIESVQEPKPQIIRQSQHLPKIHSQENILKRRQYSEPEINRSGKDLINRKRQEWNKDSIYRNYEKNLNHQVQRIEDQKKYRRYLLQNMYSQDLKRQIQERERYRKATSQHELEKDMYSIKKSKEYNENKFSEQKASAVKNKKQLWEYLDAQVKEKQKTKYNPNDMERRQFQINSDLLKNSQGIVPGQTYNIDPQRKKQFETVVKSLSPGKLDPSQKSSSVNYLASRGKNVLI